VNGIIKLIVGFFVITAGLSLFYSANELQRLVLAFINTHPNDVSLESYRIEYFWILYGPVTMFIVGIVLIFEKTLQLVFPK